MKIEEHGTIVQDLPIISLVIVDMYWVTIEIIYV